MKRWLIATLTALLLTTPVLAAMSPAEAPAARGVDVIVQFHGAVTDADLDLLRSLGFEGGHIYSAMPAVWTYGPASSLDDLSHSPRVKHWELNRDLTYDLETSRKAIHSEASAVSPGALEDLGLTGAGVTVAVVDTGIDATHPDLPFGEKVIYNHKAVAPALEGIVGFSHDAITNLQLEDTDDEGHGTHVAGTICGTGAASDGLHAGVAPGCKLIGLGMGLGPSMALATYGLDWALAHHAEYGIDVVSNSWGIRGGSEYDPDSFASQIICGLHDAGVVVVFSAGNSGPSNGTLNGDAKNPCTIGVANYDDTTGALASTSSRGVEGDPIRHPDVTAPGTGITAPRSKSAGRPALGDYQSLTGTSMSAPHVSGVAALLLQANPDLTAEQVKAIITGTADPDIIRVEDDGVYRPAQFHEQGHGVVDAYAAASRVLGDVRLAIASPDDDPVAPTVIVDDAVTVTGTTGDAAEPARPGGWPFFGGLNVYHQGVDPTVVSDPVVAPGENVSVSSRFSYSALTAYPITANTPARFTITPADAPGSPAAVLEATRPHSEDGSSGPHTRYALDAPWEVPADLAPGDYTVKLEVQTGPRDAWLTVYEGMGLQVLDASIPGAPGAQGANAAPPTATTPTAPASPTGAPAAPALPVATTQETRHSDDFESGDDGYTVENEGLGPGEATTWTRLGPGVSLWEAAHSGNYMWHVGVTSARYAYGVGYTDLADARLITPAIDLTGATTAEATFQLTGGSESGYDFLFVDAAGADGEWQTLATYTGVMDGWTLQTLDLSGFAGEEVQLRFRFVSDSLISTLAGPGWFIDDLEVAAGGGGNNTAPTVSLSADPATGSRDVTFTLAGDDADGNVTYWNLTFGDGTYQRWTGNDTPPATVNHTYAEAGIFHASLRVMDDDGAQASADAEVYTGQGPLVRAGDGPWVMATDTSGDGSWATWTADLDLTGLADGHHAIQARVPDGHGGYHATEEPILLARNPVVTLPQEVLVAEGEAFNLTATAFGASGNFTAAWDLDGDGNFTDATGLTAVNVSFATAGVHPVAVRVTDAHNGSRSTVEGATVAVYRTVNALVATGHFDAAVPDELAWSLFFGYDPAFSLVKDTYAVNTTTLASDLGGTIVGIDATLDWTHHQTVDAPFLTVNHNDFDLWLQSPDGALDSQGATGAGHEEAHVDDPARGEWQFHVEPFLVTQPDDYTLTVDVRYVPGAA